MTITSSIFQQQLAVKCKRCCLLGMGLWFKMWSCISWFGLYVLQTFPCYHQDLFLAMAASHRLKLEGQRRSIIIYLSVWVPFSHYVLGFFLNPCIKPLIRSGLFQLLCNLIKMSSQCPLPLLPDSQLCHVDHIEKKLEHRSGITVLFWKTVSLIRVRGGGDAGIIMTLFTRNPPSQLGQKWVSAFSHGVRNRSWWSNGISLRKWCDLIHIKSSIAQIISSLVCLCQCASFLNKPPRSEFWQRCSADTLGHVPLLIWSLRLDTFDMSPLALEKESLKPFHIIHVNYVIHLLHSL